MVCACVAIRFNLQKLYVKGGLDETEWTETQKWVIMLALRLYREVAAENSRVREINEEVSKL